MLDNVLDAAAGKDPAELADRLGAHGIRVKKNLYPLLRFGAKRLQKATVGSAGRKANLFTFGRGVDRGAVKALRNEPLLPYIKTLFLCVFDGSARLTTWDKWTPAAEAIVLDVGTLPGRIVKRLPMKTAKKEKLLQTTAQIETLVKHLTQPDKTVRDIDL